MLVRAVKLSEATYKLQLLIKVAESKYKHCDKVPIHGSGQGSTYSPKIYTFISSKLFQAQDEKANGIFFQSPNRKISLKIMIIGSADDSTVVTGGDPFTPIGEFV